MVSPVIDRRDHYCIQYLFALGLCKGLQMSLNDLEKVVDQDIVSVAVAEKYLTLFLGKSDWSKAIKKLWSISEKKNLDDKSRKDFLKKAISCATLIPYLEGATIPTPPENLLFWCTAWSQFNEKDWFDIYKKNIKEDIDITKSRNEIIKLGVIEPVDVSPLNRQAFNWLYEKAKRKEHLSEEELKALETKFFNLVKAYGGAIICNIFVNHKSNVEKVFNWKSGYFFEKEIHKVYCLGDIIKIKTAEIKKTNPKYIKKINSK